MRSTGRKFRFIRKKARAQWYVGPWLYGFIILCGPALVFLTGLQQSAWAWVVCAVYVAWRLRGFLRQRRYEQAFWEQKRTLAVWFSEGFLYASAGHGSQPGKEDLSVFSSVDAVEVHGSIVRLLVDKPDGSRTIYEGLDDMEAFASEFRMHASKAKYRRVRFALSLRLKEVH